MTMDMERVMAMKMIAKSESFWSRQRGGRDSCSSRDSRPSTEGFLFSKLSNGINGIKGILSKTHKMEYLKVDRRQNVKGGLAKYQNYRSVLAK